MRRRAWGDGSVYETSDGRWRGSLVVGQKPDGTSRRRYVSATTQKACELKLAKARASVAGGSTETRQSTVETWLRHWLDEIAAPNLRIRTLEGSYRPKIERVILRIGRRRLEQLDPDHIEAMYRAMQREDGLAPSTVLQIHRILHVAFKAAVRRGKVPRNPIDLVDPPRVEEQEIEPLALQQAHDVIDVLRRDGCGILNPARYGVALACGIRQGEALGLRWPDVDLEAGIITIRWQLQRLPRTRKELHLGEQVETRHPGSIWVVAAVEPNGRYLLRPVSDEAKDVVTRARKNDKRRVVDGCLRATIRLVIGDGGLVLLRTKTPKSRRLIRLPDTLADWMREHRTEQAQLRLQEGPRWVGWRTQIPYHEGAEAAADLVFPGWTGRPVDPTWDHREWQRLLTLAGAPHFRLHDARHTAATLLLAAGVRERVVMEILGHSQISMTSKYTHVLDESHTAAAEAMDGKLFTQRKKAAGA